MRRPPHQVRRPPHHRAIDRAGRAAYVIARARPQASGRRFPLERKPVSPVPPEFSRPVELTTLKPVATMRFAAAPEECAALARRMGVLAVESLAAELKLEILPGKGRLRLSGRLQAALRQACVVTLEPVATAIDERFSVIYAAEVEDDAEVAIDPGAADAWDEPWPGDTLDVGEAVTQQLALAIDPYPRAPGAAAASPAAPEGTARPFAGLSSMVKDRQGRA